MSRGISIHVGVNRAATLPHHPLTTCQATAWRMADVAARAGYDEIHVLRGASATRAAVLGEIARAADAVRAGDTLFVSFAGHGRPIRDLDGDDGDGFDETWCVHDGDVVDDELAECWRRMPRGARALVVVESCFGGGSSRGVDEFPTRPAGGPPGAIPAGPVMRGGGEAIRGVESRRLDPGPCISRGPCPEHGIRASVLHLAACAPREKAMEGLYSFHLLDVWGDGTKDISFCGLHREVSRLVTAEAPCQTPVIQMLGAEDAGFPDEPAFHLRPRGGGWRGMR